MKWGNNEPYMNYNIQKYQTYLSHIVSPLNKYCNDYYNAALTDTAATYTYLDEAVTVYCDTTTPAFGTNVKVDKGNIMSPKYQTVYKAIATFLEGCTTWLYI